MNPDQFQIALCDEIERRRGLLIDLCSQMINIPSVTGSEGPIQEFVADYFENMGLTVDKWEPNEDELKRSSLYVPTGESFDGRPVVVGVWKGSRGGNSLLINGHVDVVTEEPRSKWITDPWKAVIKDGRIFGRGASDMKSGLASAIVAVQALKEMGLQPCGDVIIESVPAEESGGNGTVAAAVRGYQADAALFTEPTSCQVQLAHRGAAFWRISVQGKAAHGGTKYKGVSAVEKGMLIAHALQRLEEERNYGLPGKHPLYLDYPLGAPVTLGIFQGGQFTSGVPEECMLEGCIEYVPGEQYVDVCKQFHDAVGEACDNDTWLNTHRPKIEWFGLIYEPAETASNSQIVSTIVNSYVSITGSRPRINGFEAGTDMRIMTNGFGIPGVIFGPGDLEMAHAPNEYVDIEQLVQATKIIALTVASWCGVE